MAEVKITILCDNINSINHGFKKDQGFSAAVEIEDKIVLFDTGMYPVNLLNNLNIAGIKVKDINAIILSHNQNDHTNGLSAILNENPNVPVYIHKLWEHGISFQGMDIPDKNILITENPGKQSSLPENILITNPLYSTDYGGIREQAVIIRFRESFILICGCCHPGLTVFLKQRESLGIDKEMPFHILGGMHGFRFSDKHAVELKSKIKSIILCHCTQNVDVFKKQFDDKCELGILGKEYRFE